MEYLEVYVQNASYDEVMCYRTFKTIKAENLKSVVLSSTMSCVCLIAIRTISSQFKNIQKLKTISPQPLTESSLSEIATSYTNLRELFQIQGNFTSYYKPFSIVTLRFTILRNLEKFMKDSKNLRYAYLMFHSKNEFNFKEKLNLQEQLQKLCSQMKPAWRLG